MKYILFAAYLLALGVGYSHACANPGEVVKENESQQWLNAHNKARKEVGVGPLLWDKGLADLAENYARELAQRCQGLVHSKSGYGENLAAKWGGKPLESMAVPVGWWVNEKQHYNYKTNSCARGKVCGHYTQVVWKRSKYLGCGSAHCRQKNDSIKSFMVCNYDPPGNFRGQKPY